MSHRVLAIRRRPRFVRALAGIVLSASAVLLAVPAQASAADPAVTGTVENLGQPISRFSILDSVMGEDALGEPTLYGSTYNAPSEGVMFFGIDPVTGAIRTELRMPGAWGGYHVAKAPDGKIYLGPENTSAVPQIWQYDPLTNVVKVVATAPEGFFCFGMTVSAFTGKVYCGALASGPHGSSVANGNLYEYDPNTGVIRLVTKAEVYPKGLVVLDAHRMIIAQGTPASVLVVNLDTGATREVLPSQYSSVFAFAYNAVRIGGYLYVQLVAPGDKIIRFDVATMTFQGEVPQVVGMNFAELSPDPYENAHSAAALAKNHPATFIANGPNGTLHEVRDDTLQDADTGVSPSWASAIQIWPVRIGADIWYASIGYQGLLGRWNPRTGQVWTKQLQFPGDPTNVWTLHAGPDGKIYGGTYETNSLFSIDPSTAKTTVLGPVNGVGGEILSMVSAQGKLFTASYTGNRVSVYDPTKPWSPSTDPSGNPRDLGGMGDQQYRPWDFIQGSSGQLYLASGATYGSLGGALTQIDPTTYQTQSWRYLAGDQALFALAAGKGEVYIGTTDHGDGVDATGDAQLLVFNEASHTVTYQTVPVPGSQWIDSLATAGNGMVYGTTLEGQWFTFDPATHTVTNQGSFPLGTVTALATGPDGDVYGLTQSALFRIDPSTNTITTLATPGGDNYRTIAFDSSGRVYFASGASVMRWTP